MQRIWGVVGAGVLLLSHQVRGDGLSLMPTAGDRTVALLSDAPDTGGEHNAVRLTLYWENDGSPVKLFARQDRHYTAGAGASLAYRADWVDAALQKSPSLPWESWGSDTHGAMGLVGALQIFTPEDIARSTPVRDDRPYAGWLYAGMFFQRAVRPEPQTRYSSGHSGLSTLLEPASYARYESLEFDLGIMGPSSLAQNPQEMIHHSFNYQTPNGWDHQIHDEPEFSIKYNRRWRSTLFQLTEGGFGFDVLPEVGFTVGSLMNEMHVGTAFRIGWGLPDDFGPGELANPADFTRPDMPSPFSLYLIGKPYGRFIAHNALLQGDNWRHDDPVTKSPIPAVFGTQFGTGISFLKYFEITYLYNVESYQFRGQHAWDCWCSLQASFTYCW